MAKSSFKSSRAKINVVEGGLERRPSYPSVEIVEGETFYPAAIQFAFLRIFFLFGIGSNLPHW